MYPKSGNRKEYSTDNLRQEFRLIGDAYEIVDHSHEEEYHHSHKEQYKPCKQVIQSL